MVTHILVDFAPLDKNSLVVVELLHHLSELADSVVETASFAEHKTLMELCARKIWVFFQGVAKLLNRLSDENVFECEVSILLLRLMLCLTLECQTFSMVELGLMLVQRNSTVKVFVSFVEVGNSQKNVSSVEEILRVRSLNTVNCNVVVLYCFICLIHVI